MRNNEAGFFCYLCKTNKLKKWFVFNKKSKCGRYEIKVKAALSLYTATSGKILSKQSSKSIDNRTISKF